MTNGISIVGYEPPCGWIIQMWLGKPGHIVCPTCGEPTQALLIREGELSTSSTEQRCDACVPRLRSVS